MSSEEVFEGSTQDKGEVLLPIAKMPSKEVSDGSTQDNQEVSLPENTLEATVTEKPIGPPPDGGFAAWLQVLGAFLLFFNSW
jgi:hypothetical protein